jgi:hypothetical protein
VAPEKIGSTSQNDSTPSSLVLTMMLVRNTGRIMLPIITVLSQAAKKTQRSAAIIERNLLRFTADFTSFYNIPRFSKKTRLLSKFRQIFLTKIHKGKKKYITRKART